MENRAEHEEVSISLNHVGSGDWTQAVRLGSKNLYSPSDSISQSISLWLSIRPLFLRPKEQMSKENLHTLDCIEAVLCRDTPDKVKTQRQEQEDLFANFILISS